MSEKYYNFFFKDVFMKRQLRFLALFLLVSSVVAAQDFVRFDAQYSYRMLDQTEETRKYSQLLYERKNKQVVDTGVYLSGQLITLADYHHSNTDSKFSYLMRHPGAGNQVGNDASELVIHSAKVALTGLPTDWASSYLELLYNPEQSFGAGTITTLTRNQIQLRRGFITFGNLEKFPVYFSVGKLDAPFSQVTTVNPFTNSTTWHAFAGLAYGGILGLELGGFSFSCMFAQGGAQFRTLNTDVEGTAVPSRVNNAVVDMNYTHHKDDISIKMGASFLNGSAYCQGYPIRHFEKCEKENPAYSVYAQIEYKKLLAKFAVARTVHEWPGTFNPDNPDYAGFAASKVTAFDIGVKCACYETDDWKLTGSFEVSEFIAGAEKSPWEKQRQIVLGCAAVYKKCCKLFGEYVHTTGYAPLNNISGNPDDGDVSPADSSTINTILVLGAQLSF